jgi:AcrR family transcriptional regulator
LRVKAQIGTGEALVSLETAEPLDGRTRRRQLNAAQLYDAASDLLASYSFDDLSVEDICAHAGIGRATFFRIFGTKAGLLREFNRRLTQDAAARIAAAGTADIATTLGHIRAAVYDAWRQAGPGHVRMAQEFVRAVPSNDPHSAHPELLGLIVAAISRAVDTGELSAAVPVDLAASLALIQLIAPMSYVLAGEDVDVDRLSQLLLDQWLRGMGVTRPRPARRSHEAGRPIPTQRQAGAKNARMAAE